MITTIESKNRHVVARCRRTDDGTEVLVRVLAPKVQPQQRLLISDRPHHAVLDLIHDTVNYIERGEL